MVRGPFVFPTKIFNYVYPKSQEIRSKKIEICGLRYRVLREIKEIIQHVVYVIGFFAVNGCYGVLIRIRLRILRYRVYCDQRLLLCPHATTSTDFFYYENGNLFSPSFTTTHCTIRCKYIYSC